MQSMTDSAVTQKRMLAELTLGEEVADLFLLASAQQGQSRNGPYWRLDLRDASGAMPGKIWSPQSQAYPELPQGVPVFLRGRVGSYREKLELTVESLRLLEEEEATGLNPALFMPASPHDPNAMLEELRALARGVLVHKPWRKLILGLLDDPDIGPRFRLAPAAKGMHHAYAGGLLEHTLSVARLCMLIADNYPELDRQILFAGALCHDLGKIWELSGGLSIDYTSEGRLLGHISLVMERLAPYLRKAGLEPDLVEHLQHLILSHHGSLEFGSPRLPATAEALVLHYADNIDAKLQQVRTALDGVPPGAWSQYNMGLERFLFQAQPSPEPARQSRPGAGAAHGRPAEKKTDAAGEISEGDSQQRSLTQSLPLFSPCSSPLKE
ncbi:HD domain-containing protein [Desulfovibrio sp. OttesenSCG-928-A18]|nr:HD domain-containing protein [Desulfovibrio sp. OttesenSCG-928-A18]